MLNDLSLHNDKKTVVFFIDSLTSADGIIGGTEKQLLAILALLDRKRFRPVLITLRANHTSKYLNGLELDWISLEISSLRSLFAFKQLYRCASLLKRINAYAVNTFFFDSSLFGITAGILASVNKRYQFRRDMGFWLNWRLVPFQRIINLLSSKIIVNSEAIKVQLVRQEKIDPKDIVVIYNGIDLSLIDGVKRLEISDSYPHLTRTSLIIGLIANFNRRVKRVDLAIKMMAIIKAKYPDSILLIVGSGSLKHELEQLCEELDVSDSVVFAGQQKDAIKYLKNFDIGLLTSDSEGFSNVLMEYMACSIAVVATDSGGNSELIEKETGILVEPGNEFLLAESLEQLLGNYEQRIQMGRNGRLRILNKFTWDKILPQIEKLFSD